MHGIVLTKLRDHVIHLHGPGTWSALVHRACLPSLVRVPAGDHPDDDVTRVVQAAALACGAGPARVLHDLGRALAPDLLTTFGFLVPPDWGPLELLDGAQEALRQVLGTDDLAVAWTGPGELSVRHDGRALPGDLVHGLVVGVGDYYGRPLRVCESDVTGLLLEVRTAVTAHLPTGAL